MFVCEWLVHPSIVGVAIASTAVDWSRGFGAECDGVRSHDLQASQLCVYCLVELTLDVVEPLGGLWEVEGD